MCHCEGEPRQHTRTAQSGPADPSRTAAHEHGDLAGGNRRGALEESDTAAAIRYALSRWPALTRYFEHGTLEIDDNAAEPALRVVALGRKNFLSTCSDQGGELAAALHSLLGCAKLNELDPETYFQHVPERIADNPVSWIDELLPWNVSLTVPESPLIVKRPQNMWTLTTAHRLPHSHSHHGSDETLTLLHPGRTLDPKNPASVPADVQELSLHTLRTAPAILEPGAVHSKRSR